MDTKAAFEKWFEPKKMAMQYRGISTIRIVRLHRCQWEAWQASRAAIEIELEPKQALAGQCHHYDAFLEGYATGWNRCVEEVASHGIRIKGKTE